jgi:hypothetical protein
MNCEDVRKQLSLLVYGELNFDEEEAVESHIDACSGCREDLAVERRLHEAVATAEAEPPQDLLSQCRRELRYNVRDLAPAPKDAPEKRGFLESVGQWFVVPQGWLKPLGAVALLALGFFAARLTTVSNPGASTPVINRSGIVAEPVSTRVRTIEPDASGHVQLVVEETRQRVLRGTIDDEQIRQMLLTAAKDPADPGLRVESVDLLKSQPESAEVRKALLASLQHDPNAGVRLKAIEGLKAFAGDSETRKVLAEVLLSDDCPGIRTQAIDLLVQKREPSVVGVLQQVLQKEDNNYVRLRSQEALRRMNASVETF